VGRKIDFIDDNEIELSSTLVDAAFRIEMFDTLNFIIKK